jgi:hypothetical protein
MTILPDPSSSIRSTTQVISVITSFFPSLWNLLVRGTAGPGSKGWHIHLFLKA